MYNPHLLHLLIIIVLMLTGVIAGVFDTIAGGGGLIVVPVMLLVGIPPIQTMGSNKLQACFGELTAAFEFWRKGHLQLRQLALGFVLVAIGSTLGTVLLQRTHPDILVKLLPLLLAGVLVYTIISPRPKAGDVQPRLAAPWFYLLIGLPIGFYNGYFGPGTGSFWVVALMFFMGFHIQKATMYAKPLNVTGNLIALAWFISAGQVWYWAGLSTGLGQIIGAKIGSHLVIHKGQKLIRPVFITVVSAMIISLLVKHFA
jgi:uncharacterized membrane protein YfcA